MTAKQTTDSKTDNGNAAFELSGLGWFGELGGEGVERPALDGRIEKRLMGVLAVEVDQARPGFGQRTLGALPQQLADMGVVPRLDQQDMRGFLHVLASSSRAT